VPLVNVPDCLPAEPDVWFESGVFTGIEQAHLEPPGAVFDRISRLNKPPIGNSAHTIMGYFHEEKYGISFMTYSSLLAILVTQN
jgi:hypothetical protein